MMKLNQLSFSKGVIFAFISGAMIIPLSYLESFGELEILGASIIDILIGLVFALLVMVPFQKRINPIRILFMAIASIVIYISMAHLAINHYHALNLDLSFSISIIVSGGLGALLTGISVQLMAPIKLRNTAYLMLIVFGSIAGYLFSYTIDSSNIIINAIGFIVWQMSVYFVIYTTKD